MSILAHIALLAWIPVVLVLFALLPARRAMITSMLGGWLFLPVAGYVLPGLPDYTKVSATSVGVLLATAIFDGGRFASLRPAWYDLPMLAWCLVPIPSALGSYGIYEGLALALTQVVIWGIPYLIGRMYITDLDGLRELAVGIVIGALIYVPLVLFEVRMSPQLHTWIYGFHQHDFLQSKRGGGWRPTVFMQHGLAVGLLMGTSALVAIWLWRARSVRSVMGIGIGAAAAVILVTALLCKSTGATVLLLLGVGTLAAASVLRTRLVIMALIVMPALYIGARTIGGWDGHELVQAAAYVSEDRAGSLRVRLDSETGVWRRIQGSLFFGVGRFTFSEADPLSEDERRVIADGMWIIALGRNGLVGLTALLLTLLLPAARFARRFPAGLYRHPQVAPGAVLAVVTVLFMLDSLFNAMLNPIFVLAAGGLASVARPMRVIPDAARHAGPPRIQKGAGDGGLPVGHSLRAR